MFFFIIVLFLIACGSTIYSFLKFFLNLLGRGFEESLKNAQDESPRNEKLR